MLSQVENEYLCHTGPGSPMGTLLRRYWLPVMLVSELPEADCPPVRVKVLSEDLVAFRDSSGQVGLLEAHCPHRAASLFFGRNEEAGLRCVYHGWKFDTVGRCVDMPSEPAESNFKHKVTVRAYPTVESAGMVWAYMGPPETMRPFRRLPFDFIPREEWNATKTIVYCNYVQSMEGNIDSSHISFLHRSFRDWTYPDDGTDTPGYPTFPMSAYIRATSRNPRLEIEDTEYGFRYAAIRRTPAGHTHVRMSVQVMPVITFVADPLPSQLNRVGLIIVPRDDGSCWRFGGGVRQLAGAPPLVIDDGPQRIRGPWNDYLIDREMQRTGNYTGIIGVANQDYAVTESMGPIYDRRKEHLGTSDLAIIRMRRQLIEAARNLERGIEPPGLDPDYPWHHVRSEERILAPGESWHALATLADPKFRELVGA